MKMWKLVNNIIEMNKGDYLKMPLFINMGTRFEPKRYVVKGNDKVYISIAEPNQPWAESLIKKVYTKDDLNKWCDIEFELKSEDTENVLPGKYYIEIKLLQENGIVTTILPKKQFWIFE